MRLLFAALGTGAVGFAVAGLLLPGLPTTVFVLIAAYCFSKSSPRLAQWLSRHRWLGPHLARYSRARGLSRETKRAALAAMWISVLVSATLLSGLSPTAAVATIALGALGTLAILFGVRTVASEL